MIISTFIAVVCFIVVVFEFLSMYNTFKKCVKIKCRVASSEKTRERENGFLTDEYWKTEVNFEYGGKTRKVVLKTSTYCQKGQIIECYYYPFKDLVFRKRDLKNLIRSSSLVVTSVGILFLFLNFLFRIANVSSLVIKNIASILSVIITVLYSVIGIWYIAYSANAIKNTSKKRVTQTSAKIVDVIRKSKRHKENEQFAYYPIYRYTFKGESHETQSKLKRTVPPKKGSTVSILIDNKKGGPVEYNDVANSMVMGICFIIIAALMVYLVWFRT